MSTPEEKTIANLPVPDASARGTMSAEELAAIMARARAETAGKVVTIGDEQREREEREAAESEACARWQQEQREVRAIDADTDARRAQATGAMVRGGAMVGGGVLAGLALGGPVGAVVGGAVGWIADHLIEHSRGR